MDLYTIHVLLDILDVVTCVFLGISTVFSYKTSKVLKTKLISYLILGFGLSLIAQIGFVILNYIPIEIIVSSDRMYGNTLIAFRVLPIFFLMLGSIGIYTTAIKYINGNK